MMSSFALRPPGRASSCVFASGSLGHLIDTDLVEIDRGLAGKMFAGLADLQAGQGRLRLLQELRADGIELALVIVLCADAEGRAFDEAVGAGVDDLNLDDLLGGVVQRRILLEREGGAVRRKAQHFSRSRIARLRGRREDRQRP